MYVCMYTWMVLYVYVCIYVYIVYVLYAYNMCLNDEWLYVCT